MTLLAPPALQCVLENLEVTKRAHIVARSPALQELDELVPIIVERISLNKQSLTIRDLKIQPVPKEKTVKFEDIEKGIIAVKPLPENLKGKDAIKRIYDVYLGIRSDIYVDRVKFLSSTIELPENLNLTINGLDTHTHSVEPFLQYIDKSSFPLEILKTVIKEEVTMKHPVILSAEDLLIVVKEDAGIKQLTEYQKIERPVLFFKYYNLQTDSVVELIRDWRANKKAVGTIYNFIDEDEECVMVVLELEEIFGEFKNELKSVQEIFHPTLPRFLIPIDETSQIQVYECKTVFDNEECDELVIKIVAPEEEEADSEMAESDLDEEEQDSEMEGDDMQHARFGLEVEASD